MAYDDDLNTAKVTFVGVMGTLVVAIVFVLVQVVYYQYVDAFQASQQQEPYAEISGLVAKQQAALNGYAWVDPQKKIVSIPIQQAMRLVVAEGAAPPSGAAPAAKESGDGK